MQGQGAAWYCTLSEVPSMVAQQAVPEIQAPTVLPISKDYTWPSGAYLDCSVRDVQGVRDSICDGVLAKA
jgi:hypothetical protein|tara:strand:- start:445 stop:654 length:210 start_codon:yes stop_codon:yes gene_type:complete